MVLSILAVLLTSDSVPPPVPREFRAVWVATVDNIDWPSRRGLSTERQKAELIRILDRASTLHLNAVLLQVRPAADALYDSSIEPWSEYLTGRQGQAPAPYYDPLAFAVAEAHKRGLELHAWINPYRARHPSAKGPLASNHIAVTDPGLVRQYGDLLWMDPGEPSVRVRTLEVVADVVKRYDIDGVHIDDYFYPYPENGREFPDRSSYASRGGGMDRGDWRRANVDGFVSAVYREIHAIKPWVQFGISPFGIYRPGVPGGIRAGVDQYAELFSDPLKWLRNGWCDYLSPQLYWPISQKAQSFTTLLTWWNSQNVLHRHVWPGLYTSRTMSGGTKGATSAAEIVRQIEFTRQFSDPGDVQFSMKPLIEDSGGIDEALSGSVYQEEALPPASEWLGPRAPGRPVVSAAPDGSISWRAGAGARPFWYVVWLRYGNRWLTHVVPGSADKWNAEPRLAAGTLREVCVAAASRCAVLSKVASVTLREEAR
jgi:uncharacterized lipoprotein YddW (UPF0748 family)